MNSVKVTQQMKQNIHTNAVTVAQTMKHDI